MYMTAIAYMQRITPVLIHGQLPIACEWKSSMHTLTHRSCQHQSGNFITLWLWSGEGDILLFSVLNKWNPVLIFHSCARCSIFKSNVWFSPITKKFPPISSLLFMQVWVMIVAEGWNLDQLKPLWPDWYLFMQHLAIICKQPWDT